MTLASPEFELPPDGHVFDAGDEIYVIDDNKYDLLRAAVAKKTSKSYSIRFDDGDNRSFKTAKRLLLRTSANTAIFDAQQALIRSAPPITDDSPPPKRSLPPILSADFIVREAWRGGIRDADGLKTLLKARMDEAAEVYETRARLLALDKSPLFALGGVSAPDAAAFWARAKAQWKGLFGDEVSVPRDQFLRKAAEAFRLPNQTGGNAREILRSLFEEGEVAITAFCLMLAQFGPGTALMRKLGAYWKAPERAREAVKGVNLGEIGIQELVEAEGNSFEVETAAGWKTLYNLVSVESDAQYLVDAEGKAYASWIEFFEANPVGSEEGAEEEERGD